MSRHILATDVADLCPEENGKVGNGTTCRHRKRRTFELAVLCTISVAALLSSCALTAWLCYKSGYKSGLEAFSNDMPPPAGWSSRQMEDFGAYWAEPNDSEEWTTVAAVEWTEDDDFAPLLFRRVEEKETILPVKGRRVNITRLAPGMEPPPGAQKIFFVPEVKIDLFCTEHGFTAAELPQPTSGIHKLPDLNLDGKPLTPSPEMPEPEFSPAPELAPIYRARPRLPVKVSEPNPVSAFDEPFKSKSDEPFPGTGAVRYENGRKITERKHPGGGMSIQIEFPPDDPVALGIGGLEGDVGPPVPEDKTFTTYHTNTPKDDDDDETSSALAKRNPPPGSHLSHKDKAKPKYPVPAGPDSHRTELHGGTPALNFPNEVYSDQKVGVHPS
ncbi:hypothetical protein B0T22DRAFT_245140 [Podospora appendiculata]|uniref:Uncharacterized protein n=1 Tax=Podospora appendiculata TaxID=314037 RepID=A0AAE0X208_9PEZI|nr:hypothetical protein B0T22DRAFT_245140 [Podospora appendiculata]